jgi:hypothetical protein
VGLLVAVIMIAGIGLLYRLAVKGARLPLTFAKSSWWVPGPTMASWLPSMTSVITKLVEP